jgi:phosphocarrier protein HPr
MTSEVEPLRKEVIVVNELGLHARSAAKLAKAAQQARGRVWLEKDNERIDAKQIIDILSLAAAQGDRVCIAIDAAGDASVLDQLVVLFETGFGE